MRPSSAHWNRSLTRRHDDSFQVSPSDLENVLCGSPLIADAGVTSIYSSSQGTELPRAYIVPSGTRLVGLCKPAEGMGVSEELRKLGDEVRRHVEGKVAHYKWSASLSLLSLFYSLPRSSWLMLVLVNRLRGNVVFVPQIPKSPSSTLR